jgi:hypothetical protein
MNTSIPKTVSVKLVISFIIIIYLPAVSIPDLIRNILIPNWGYVMEDATGYFFIPLDKGKGCFLKEIKGAEKSPGLSLRWILLRKTDSYMIRWKM